MENRHKTNKDSNCWDLRREGTGQQLMSLWDLNYSLGCSSTRYQFQVPCYFLCSTHLFASRTSLWGSAPCISVMREEWNVYTGAKHWVTCRLTKIHFQTRLIKSGGNVAQVTWIQHTCLFNSNMLLKCQLNKRWQFHAQVNLMSAGSEKCTSHIRSRDEAGAGASLSQNYEESLQTDMNLQLASSWRLLKVCDSVWGSTKGHVRGAANVLRQATIPERLYLGRITSAARYNLTFAPQGSHTALLTNDSVTFGLRPRWNRLKRTKHVFAGECCAARQI